MRRVEPGRYRATLAVFDDGAFARGTTGAMIPAALQTVMRESPTFWTDWFFVTDVADSELERYEPTDGATVVIGARSDGTALTIRIDCGLSYFQLCVREPGAEPRELGFDDQATFHPHALRWVELETIARAMALRGALPHPGLVVALGCRFAPLCEHDDADAIVPILEAALLASGARADQIDAIFDRIDRRDCGFRWQCDGARWTIAQPEARVARSGVGLYSLRDAENVEFPHDSVRRAFDEASEACAGAVDPAWRTAVVMDAIRRFTQGDVDAAESLGRALAELGCAHPVILDGLRAPIDPARAAWIVEVVAGAPWSTVVAAHFGQTLRPALDRYAVSVRMPGGRSARVEIAALAIAGLGATFVGSATKDGRVLESQWNVTVRGNLEAALDAIERALRDAHAPGGTRISWNDDGWKHRFV